MQRRSPEWIFSPISFEQFRADFWNRASLRLTERDPSFYGNLLPKDVLNFVVSTATRLPRAVEELKEDESARACRSKTQAVEALKAGRSLRVNGIQRFAPAVAELSHELEQLLSCTVNINMYLTPGAGKALPVHFDTHDVFVLQLRGSKRWFLYDKPVSWPIEYLPLLRGESIQGMKRHRLQRDTSAKPDLQMTEEFTLQAGDFLYVPRGHWHRAQSTDDGSSCHLTIGLYMPTVSDVLTVSLAHLTQSDARFRAYIPLGYATHSDATKQVSEMVQDLMGEVLQETVRNNLALKGLQDKFERTHGQMSTATLESARTDLVGEISTATECTIADGLLCSVHADGDHAILHFGGANFDIPPSHVDACRFIARQQSFVVKDLPGNISDHEKIALTTHLLIEGLLSRQEPERKAAPAESANQWLPTSINFSKREVKWVDFRTVPIDKPFFEQTVTSLEKRGPKRTKLTPLTTLDAVPETDTPAGFIFHVSRCGSTLLSNAMRVMPDSLVLSEPKILSDCLGALSDPDNPTTQEAVLHSLQKALAGLCGRSVDAKKRVVVKFSSWNVLYFETLRKLWPSVPCIFLIRDPAAVAVSAMVEETGWMRWRHRSELAVRRLRLTEQAENLDTRPAQYSATVLTAFFSAILSGLDERCRTLDYSELTPQKALEMGTYFGLGSDPDTLSAITKTFGTYSKDPSAIKLFTSDEERKQSEATEELTSAVNATARPLYDSLRALTGSPEAADELAKRR